NAVAGLWGPHDSSGRPRRDRAVPLGARKPGRRGWQEKRCQSPHPDELAKTGRRLETSLSRSNETLIAFSRPVCTPAIAADVTGLALSAPIECEGWSACASSSDLRLRPEWVRPCRFRQLAACPEYLRYLPESLRRTNGQFVPIADLVHLGAPTVAGREQRQCDRS